MFQTFSGSSRRPRQVNLSGRTANSVQSSWPSRVPGGGSDALAHAQAERQARKNERDRLIAAKRLQKTWRGHSTRKELRKRYKGLLEESERRLAGKSPEARSEEEVQANLRLCVHAVQLAPSDGWAAEKLLLAGRWACQMLARSRSNATSSSWLALMRALTKLLLRSLSVTLWPRQSPWDKRLRPREHDSSGLRYVSTSDLKQVFDELAISFPNVRQQVQSSLSLLIATLRFLASSSDYTLLSLTIPQNTFAIHIYYQDIPAIEHYYRVLGRILQLSWIPEERPPNDLIGVNIEGRLPDRGFFDTYLTSALTAPDVKTVSTSKSIHQDLILGLLTTPDLPEDVIYVIGSLVGLGKLLESTRSLLDNTDGPHSAMLRSSSADAQWLLGNIILLCKTMLSPEQSQYRSASKFSLNLNFMRIVNHVLGLEVHANGILQYTRHQLQSLIRPEYIAGLFDRTAWLSDQGNPQHDADVLADYILTILRTLPQQADEVRMWLYLSHSTTQTMGDTQASALRFFWNSASYSYVFSRASIGWKDATKVLPDNWGTFSEPDGPLLNSDWKHILLFMELYTFALRVQDDEQFMLGVQADDHGLQQQSSTLTLAEIKALVVFLKNVTYSLYTQRNIIWNIESSPGMANTLSPASKLKILQTSIPQSSSGLVHQVNLPHMKGSATALLRMLYERDSRRTFLPPKHFLMDDVEGSTFVQIVVQEMDIRERIEGDAEYQDISSDESFRAHQRSIAKAAPRVEVLENIPFVVPFEIRVNLFRQFVLRDMDMRRQGDAEMWRLRNAQILSRDVLGRHSAELRRDHVFEDAFKAYYTLGEALKEPIRISFVGEQGIDGGGVTKEFLASITKDVFSAESPHHLFVENDQHQMYPYPAALDEIDEQVRVAMAAGEVIDQSAVNQVKRQKLQYYEFIGRVIGKCLYEGILVDIPLARFFVAKWALTGGDRAARNETTFRPSINDLYDYDQAIYRSMLSIKNYKGDVRELGLEFAVDDDIGGGKTVNRELKPGGSQIPVDNKNRLIYIALMTKHYLVDRQGPQTRAFLEGLSTIIKPTWLRMFNEAEIKTLLGGESRPIDVEDLRRNTVYSGVYQIGDDGQEHPTIQMFWEVMHEMKDSDRRKLLQYVTSTANAPLMGFEHLIPRFAIRDAQSDQGRLPTSSTCANLLKLPIYRTKQVLRDKIMAAIHSGAGFDLS